MLGGKNTGKSCALKRAIAMAKKEHNNTFILVSDMRNTPSATLLEEIKTKSEQAVPSIPFLADLVALFATSKILLDVPTAAGAAAPLSAATRNIWAEIEKSARGFFFENSERLGDPQISIVIDEANLGLPRKGQELEGRNVVAPGWDRIPTVYFIIRVC